MDAFVEASWRVFPATAIMAAGLLLATYGWRTLVRGLRISAWDPHRSIVGVSGLRAVLIGTAIAGLGASWLWQQLWLLLLSLAIGGEELLETTFILYVLRWGRRQQTLAGR